MVSGLSPETLGGFITQRIRWAQGMIQIFLLKNPFLVRGLSFPQRLCYFTARSSGSSRLRASRSRSPRWRSCFSH